MTLESLADVSLVEKKSPFHFSRSSRLNPRGHILTKCVIFILFIQYIFFVVPELNNLFKCHLTLVACSNAFLVASLPWFHVDPNRLCRRSDLMNPTNTASHQQIQHTFLCRIQAEWQQSSTANTAQHSRIRQNISKVTLLVNVEQD